MAAKKTASTTADLDVFIRSLRDLCSAYLGDGNVISDTTPADVDEDGADDEGTGYTEANLKKMTVAALRKLAIEEGFDKDDVKESSKNDLIDALLEDADVEDEEGEDESEEEADDAEDAEDDSEERAELMALSLAKLRKTAREDYSADPTELKGLDKEGIVDLILSAESEDDAEADEEEADEDGYTEDELSEMELSEIKEVLTEWGIDFPKGRVRKTTLIKLVLEAQEEGDE